jgi:hypothetical protein
MLGNCFKQQYEEVLIGCKKPVNQKLLTRTVVSSIKLYQVLLVWHP